MKTIIQLLKWLLIIISLIVLFSILLSVLFQQRIESAALQQLDKITNSQLKYGDANFNYINSFPSISLDLSNPTFYDNDYDTALELEEFQVRINIFKSIFSDPVISRLVIKNGSVTLRERNQKWNIVDLITNSNNSSDTSPLINIDHLIVENFKVVIDRGTADQITQLTLVDADMELKSSDAEVNIFAQGRLSLDYVINNGDHQLIKINDSFQADLSFDKSSKIVTIAPSQLDQGLTMEGWFNSSNSQRDIKLDIQNWKVNRLNTWLSEITLDEEKQIALEGKVSGIVSFDDVSDIDYTVYIKNGAITRGRETQIQFEDIHSTLTGNQEELALQQLELEIDGEKLNADLQYSIKQNILESVSIEGNIPIKPLHTITGDSVLTKLDGTIAIEEFAINQYPIATDKSILEYLDFSGDFKNIRLQSNLDKIVKADNGKIRSIGEELHFSGLEVELEDSEFTLNGLFVIEENKNVFKCQINGEKINATDILHFSNSSESRGSNFLEENRLYVSIAVDKLLFNKIDMTKVNAELRSINDVLATTVEAKVFDGYIKSNGRLKHDSDEYQYHFTIDGDNIDLKECFAQTENFGQTVITDKQLKGTFSSLASFDLFYDEEWNILPTKTKGLISAKIKNGQIKNLEMMKQFSSMVNINDLKDIKFTELNNYLEIKGKNLFVPTMFIQSNAANFLVSGYHSIENVQAYYLKVNAGQILANKFKRHNPDLPPKPDRRNGMFNLHYVINGTSESYQYRRDRNQVRKAFKTGEERKRLIYNELVKEFGPNERLQFDEIQ